MDIKKRLSEILYRIRNPEYDDREREFKKELNAKRILILLPFIIAAVIFLLLSFGK